VSVPVEEGVDWRFFLRFSEAVPSEKYYFKPLNPKEKKNTLRESNGTANVSDSNAP